MPLSSVKLLCFQNIYLSCNKHLAQNQNVKFGISLKTTSVQMPKQMSGYFGPTIPGKHIYFPSPVVLRQDSWFKPTSCVLLVYHHRLFIYSTTVMSREGKFGLLSPGKTQMTGILSQCDLQCRLAQAGIKSNAAFPVMVVTVYSAATL